MKSLIILSILFWMNGAQAFTDERIIDSATGGPYELQGLGQVYTTCWTELPSPGNPGKATWCPTAVFKKVDKGYYQVLPTNGGTRPPSELKIIRSNVCMVGACTYAQLTLKFNGAIRVFDIRALYLNGDIEIQDVETRSITLKKNRDELNQLIDSANKELSAEVKK
ncbi:MAG TPA: hypothetical protein VN132_09335, partial [Bdellovibrio sp.]|nr:hypothetical protein [Bdellovibrio sp.]